MMMHRFKVPPRPVGSAALTPAKAAARRVYAQAVQEMIGNIERLGPMLKDFQRHIERDRSRPSK